ncbi:MAG: nitrate reductase [candidate division Zixibacteria bacterium]|nr:nitrate reductase [candidate division Zixibacteria bacterium]
MYEFARGPLVWIAFIVFFLGLFYRLVMMIIQSRKDKVVLPYIKMKEGINSIAHWVIPFGSRNMRLRPAFTIISFLFHICLLITPVFVLGHIVLFQQSWGISWWHIPEQITNIMTMIVVVGGLFFFLRRIGDPTVRFVTSWSDFVLLIIVLAPFITGLMAYYQAFDYRTVITIHMISGALWLMVIPFTRIVHMLFFPFTRAYMGSEFGYVRNAKDW